MLPFRETVTRFKLTSYSAIGQHYGFGKSALLAEPLLPHLLFKEWNWILLLIPRCPDSQTFLILLGWPPPLLIAFLSLPSNPPKPWESQHFQIFHGIIGIWKQPRVFSQAMCPHICFRKPNHWALSRWPQDDFPSMFLTALRSILIQQHDSKNSQPELSRQAGLLGQWNIFLASSCKARLCAQHLPLLWDLSAPLYTILRQHVRSFICTFFSPKRLSAVFRSKWRLTCLYQQNLTQQTQCLAFVTQELSEGLNMRFALWARSSLRTGIMGPSMGQKGGDLGRAPSLLSTFLLPALGGQLCVCQFDHEVYWHCCLQESLSPCRALLQNSLQAVVFMLLLSICFFFFFN